LNATCSAIDRNLLSRMQVVIDVPGTFVNDTLMRCTSPAISNLCTKSTYCDGQNEADPRWRGCIKWKTCPFFAQCEVPSPACGCPDGPNCLQREDPEGGEEVLLSRDQVARPLSYPPRIPLPREPWKSNEMPVRWART